ncbi:MAG TPA: adenine deaminase C-terminal domain-containing protein [Opitutaceae bacterium]|nr:adenine deaminase C-terminal domain-containing protein [Opitutaceae bacterium]
MGLTRFSVPPLHRVTRELAAVAMGRELPDLVVTGARILSTFTERIHASREVWIRSGRIAAVKPAGSCRPPKGSNVRFFDACGGIVAPGLVDPHIHIESSMMTACAYAEPALLNGTTTIFCDSHEIGNVCDARGIEWMLEDARRAPLSIFLTVPSTVPATGPRFETAGGDLTPGKIGRIFDRWPEAVGLGEKMDYVQVAMGDRRSHAVLAQALRRGLPVSGHIYGREFVAAGAASGISDTHEAIDRDIADDFLECGVWVFLRGGPPTTPWNSLPLAIKAVTELGASPKRVCVCTDDRDADDLFVFGMDWVARCAVRAGIRPATAWSMGSLHPATRFGMDGEIGGLAPARRADLVLLNDSLEPQSTWFGGELVVRDRKVTSALERALSRRYRYPPAAYATVKLPDRPVLVPALPGGPVVANVIRTVPHKIILLHHRLALRPRPGETWAGLLERHGLCFVAVVERHGRSGAVAHGLLKDFGLREGAVGSSVGHDAHNVILAGRSESDMRRALAEIRRMRGGVCVVRGGRVVARVALPVAGLISDKRAPVVAAETTRLKRAWKAAGCTLPYMGFNLIPLSVIPEIRITDKGLVTVPGMRIVPLFEPV